MDRPRYYISDMHAPITICVLEKKRGGGSDIDVALETPFGFAGKLFFSLFLLSVLLSRLPSKSKEPYPPHPDPSCSQSVEKARALIPTRKHPSRTFNSSPRSFCHHTAPSPPHSLNTTSRASRSGGGRDSRRENMHACRQTPAILIPPNSAIYTVTSHGGSGAARAIPLPRFGPYGLPIWASAALV